MQNNLLIYQKDNWNISVDILVEDETFWIIQTQMWEIFWKSRNTITEHISNIYSEWELEK
jgi:hypothetical protein